MTDPVKICPNFVDQVKIYPNFVDPVKIIILSEHVENLMFGLFDSVKILNIFLIRWKIESMRYIMMGDDPVRFMRTVFDLVNLLGR